MDSTKRWRPLPFSTFLADKKQPLHEPYAMLHRKRSHQLKTLCLLSEISEIVVPILSWAQ